MDDEALFFFLTSGGGPPTPGSGYHLALVQAWQVVQLPESTPRDALAVLLRLMRADSNYNLQPALPSDVSSITRTLYSLNDGKTIDDQRSRPTSIILLQLSTGSFWRRDVTGFNVIDFVATPLLADQIGCRIEYQFTMADGATAVWRRDVVLERP